MNSTPSLSPSTSLMASGRGEHIGQMARDEVLIGADHGRLDRLGVLHVGLDELAQHAGDEAKPALARGLQGLADAAADALQPLLHLRQHRLPREQRRMRLLRPRKLLLAVLRLLLHRRRLRRGRIQPLLRLLDQAAGLIGPGGGLAAAKHQLLGLCGQFARAALQLLPLRGKRLAPDGEAVDLVVQCGRAAQQVDGAVLLILQPGAGLGEGLVAGGLLGGDALLAAGQFVQFPLQLAKAARRCASASSRPLSPRPSNCWQRAASAAAESASSWAWRRSISARWLQPSICPAVAAICPSSVRAVAVQVGQFGLGGRAGGLELVDLRVQARKLVGQRRHRRLQLLPLLAQAVVFGQAEEAAQLRQAGGVFLVVAGLARLVLDAAQALLHLFQNVGQAEQVLLDPLQPAQGLLLAATCTC